MSVADDTSQFPDDVGVADLFRGDRIRHHIFHEGNCFVWNVGDLSDSQLSVCYGAGHQNSAG